MKRTIGIVVMGILLAAAPMAIAMQGHNSSGSGQTYSGTADHGSGGQGDASHKIHGIFKQEAVSEGVRAEFQVMTLESMNMKDPAGNTHHIMVKLFSESSDEQLKDAVGKVKIISPSKKETVSELKDYSGIFAANFKVDEPGDYGVICLLKVNDKKPLYKFWYHNMQ
ncbi:MAG: hypothetical protein PVG46_00030 [Desulfobacterales bacterium]